LKTATRRCCSTPQQRTARRNRGVTYAVKGDWDHALADLDQLIKEQPLNWECYYTRAAIYAKKGDPAKAKADWDKAVQLNPGLANAPFPTILEEHEKPAKPSSAP